MWGDFATSAESEVELAFGLTCESILRFWKRMRR